MQASRRSRGQPEELRDGEEPEAALAQRLDDAGQRLDGRPARASAVVHEDDRAVACLPQHGREDPSRTRQRPVTGVDVPLHGDHLGRRCLLQQPGRDVPVGRAEQAGDVAGRALDGPLSLLDLQAGHDGVLGEVDVGEGVVADRVAVAQHPLQQGLVAGDVLADDEEGSGGAFTLKLGDDPRGVRPRAVVEGQGDRGHQTRAAGPEERPGGGAAGHRRHRRQGARERSRVRHTVHAPVGAAGSRRARTAAAPRRAHRPRERAARQPDVGGVKAQHDRVRGELQDASGDRRRGPRRARRSERSILKADTRARAQTDGGGGRTAARGRKPQAQRPPPDTEGRQRRSAAQPHGKRQDAAVLREPHAADVQRPPRIRRVADQTRPRARIGAGDGCGQHDHSRRRGGANPAATQTPHAPMIVGTCLPAPVHNDPLAS